MSTFIITAGGAFVDIDFFACAEAYEALLKLEGKDAVTVLSGVLNETIPPTVRSWWDEYLTEIPSDIEDPGFVLVDISEEKYFAPFVVKEKIVEIYDHHFGFEQYWEERLGSDAHIAHVGSCATLIWEAYKLRGKEKEISTRSANLLYTAIFANSLDFQAHVTTERDRFAAEELSSYISLDATWKAQYYREVESAMLQDFESAVANDTKRVEISGTEYIIGQLEVWNATDILEREHFLDEVRRGLGVDIESHQKWFLSIISIEEEKNYLVAEHFGLQKELESAIQAYFEEGVSIGQTKRLWMRKEILRELMRL